MNKMAISNQARGIQGLSAARRKLRLIHTVTENTLKPVMKEVAESIKQDAIARVPIDTGDLARSIDYTQSSDGLTAVVGPGAKAVRIIKRRVGSAFAVRSSDLKLSTRSKGLLMQYFKGYWLEFGTKGDPSRNIPPLPARPFMGPAYDVNAEWAKKRVRAEIAATLNRVARSG